MKWIINDTQRNGVEKLYDFYVRKKKDNPQPFQIHHSAQNIDWKNNELSYSGLWNKNGWKRLFNDCIEVLLTTHSTLRKTMHYEYNLEIKNKLNILIELKKNWDMDVEMYNDIYDRKDWKEKNKTD